MDYLQNLYRLIISYAEPWSLWHKINKKYAIIYSFVHILCHLTHRCGAKAWPTFILPMCPHSRDKIVASMSQQRRRQRRILHAQRDDIPLILLAIASRDLETRAEAAMFHSKVSLERTDLAPPPLYLPTKLDSIIHRAQH